MLHEIKKSIPVHFHSSAHKEGNLLKPGINERYYPLEDYSNVSLVICEGMDPLIKDKGYYLCTRTFFGSPYKLSYPLYKRKSNYISLFYEGSVPKKKIFEETAFLYGKTIAYIIHPYDRDFDKFIEYRYEEMKETTFYDKRSINKFMNLPINERAVLFLPSVSYHESYKRLSRTSNCIISNDKVILEAESNLSYPIPDMNTLHVVYLKEI